MKYKLRAECAVDIAKMLYVFIPTAMTMKRHEIFPDVTLEFETILSLKEIKTLLAKVEDGHVMVETVQLLASYTGERE